MMMKRKIIKLLAVTLVAIMVAGCSKTQNPPAGSDNGDNNTEPVSIVFMHDEAEEERMTVYQEIIDGFMAENPGIIVIQEAVGEDGFEAKVITQVAGGSLPAIIASGTELMQKLDEEEIINTRANREVIEEIGSDNFYTGILDIINSLDGTGATCVPISGWVAGIWYREDLFAEKGLNPPEKWEDILIAAETFHDPQNKMYGIMIGTGEAANTQNHFQLFSQSNGAQLFDEKGQPQFNSLEMKETMEFYRELYQYTIPGSNDNTTVRDTFVSGNAAMSVFSTYIMGPLYNADMADKVGFAIPEHTQKSVFGSPSAYSISNTITPAETEAAKKFIAYILSDEVNIKLLHMAAGGANPVLRSVADTPEYWDVDVLEAFGDTAKSIPASFDELKVLGVQDGVTNPNAGSIMNAMIIGKAVNQILVHGADLEIAMEKAQQEMLALVN